jgi:outer membrane protein assembly factor BamD (BamD/ComL family)
MMKKYTYFIGLGLFAVVFMLEGCNRFKSVDQMFQTAEALRKDGKMQAAIEQLDAIVTEHREHERAAEAQYLIAEIYYRDLKDFKRAVANYQKIAEWFPQSEKIPYALFMEGFIYANVLSDFSAADTIYQNFLNRFPEHELAPSVEFELKYLGKDIDEIPELEHIAS